MAWYEHKAPELAKGLEKFVDELGAWRGAVDGKGDGGAWYTLGQ